MAELNVIISPTQSDIVQRQQEAVGKASQLAGNIEGVDSAQQALIREILPSDDLGSGGGNNWTETNQEWIQGGLSADQENDVYDITSTDEQQNKITVFYGLANLAGQPKTTEVIFKDGTGATFADFNVQVLQSAELSDVVLFEEDIVYGATDNGTLTQWANQAGADEMVYLAKVVEPLGETLSTRESPTAQQGGGRRRSAQPARR